MKGHSTNYNVKNGYFVSPPFFFVLSIASAKQKPYIISGFDDVLRQAENTNLINASIKIFEDDKGFAGMPELYEVISNQETTPRFVIVSAISNWFDTRIDSFLTRSHFPSNHRYLRNWLTEWSIESCRHPGAPTSIMYNPQDALERAHLKFIDIWKYDMLGPEGNSTQNEVALKKGIIPPLDGLKKLGATNIKKIASVVRNSLLSMQQFNVIVRPGNISNRLYYGCAANSTRLIFPKGATINGKMQDLNMSCIQTPVDCKDPLVWAGSPEEIILIK